MREGSKCGFGESGCEARVRVAGFEPFSVCDGPGIRAVVFAQGCPHRCEGCHNPSTWDCAGGTLVSVEELEARVLEEPMLDGVTISGGEPFLQAEQFAVFARKVAQRGLSVVTYTGYTWEQLMTMGGGARSLLEACWALVDGPYVQALRSAAGVWRGSSNQRAIDVSASFEQRQVIFCDAFGPAVRVE